MNKIILFGEKLLSELKSENLNLSERESFIKITDTPALKTFLKVESVDVLASFYSDLKIGDMAKIVVGSGWKAFRVGYIDLKSGKNAEKLAICYKGEASEILDDFVFSKRFSLVELKDYLLKRCEKLRFDALRNRLKAIFAKIGIYSNLLGYEYLISAVTEVSKDKRLITSLTTGLYPLLAKKFQTSEKNIERNMRNAIEVSYNRGKFFSEANSLGGNFSPYEKPSNGEFIAFLAEMTAE